MDATRNPSPLLGPISTERALGQERNTFCASYDCCLDEAVRQGWNGWTCERCHAFTAGRVAVALEHYAQSRVACAWPA